MAFMGMAVKHLPILVPLNRTAYLVCLVGLSTFVLSFVDQNKFKILSSLGLVAQILAIGCLLVTSIELTAEDDQAMNQQEVVLQGIPLSFGILLFGFTVHSE